MLVKRVTEPVATPQSRGRTIGIRTKFVLTWTPRLKSHRRMVYFSETRESSFLLHFVLRVLNMLHLTHTGIVPWSRSRACMCDGLTSRSTLLPTARTVGLCRNRPKSTWQSVYMVRSRSPMASHSHWLLRSVPIWYVVGHDGCVF